MLTCCCVGIWCGKYLVPGFCDQRRLHASPKIKCTWFQAQHGKVLDQALNLLAENGSKTPDGTCEVPRYAGMPYRAGLESFGWHRAAILLIQPTTFGIAGPLHAGVDSCGSVAHAKLVQHMHHAGQFKWGWAVWSTSELILSSSTLTPLSASCSSLALCLPSSSDLACCKRGMGLAIGGSAAIVEEDEEQIHYLQTVSIGLYEDRPVMMSRPVWPTQRHKQTSDPSATWHSS